MLLACTALMTESLRLIDGPDAAAATVVLAHGAGAPMDSPFMQTVATGLAARGWRVVRFEFPYMVRRRHSGRKAVPDRLPVLRESFRAQVELERQAPSLVIGGKSMGGRVASLIADEMSVAGCLCLGYPFHPPGKPTQLRTEHLTAMQTPTLILQGERDSFGRRDEIEHKTLAPSIALQWLPAGDHSFKPNRQSGCREHDNLELAIALADQAIQRWCQPH